MVSYLPQIFIGLLQRLNTDDQRDIFDDLQQLDQEEITLKRVRHDGGDKV